MTQLNTINTERTSDAVLITFNPFTHTIAYRDSACTHKQLGVWMKPVTCLDSSNFNKQMAFGSNRTTVKRKDIGIFCTKILNFAKPDSFSQTHTHPDMGHMSLSVSPSLVRCAPSAICIGSWVRLAFSKQSIYGFHSVKSCSVRCYWMVTRLNQTTSKNQIYPRGTIGSYIISRQSVFCMHERLSLCIRGLFVFIWAQRRRLRLRQRHCRAEIVHFVVVHFNSCLFSEKIQIEKTK